MHKKRFFRKILPCVLVLALLGGIRESRTALAEPQTPVMKVAEESSATPVSSLPPAPSTMPTPTDSFITPAPTIPPASYTPFAPSNTPVPTATPTIVDKGSCGIDATWTLDDKGVLRITGKGSIAEQAFRLKENIKTVIISGNITAIEGAAFLDCRGITAVTIQSPVQSIADCAFEGCKGLSAFAIPSTVTVIGAHAFYNTGLKGITIPSGVTSIGIQSFANNPSLSSTKLEGASTKIGWGAFFNLAVSAVVKAPVNFSDVNALQQAINGSSRIEYEGTGPSSTTIPTITMAPYTPVAPVVTSSTPKPTASAVPTVSPAVVPTIEPEPTASAEPPAEDNKPPKVVIKKAVCKKKNTILVKWKKVENGDGYQVRYSTNKSFKKKKTKTLTETKVTLKKLKGKEYYVSVRAFYVGLNGIVYGPWGKKKKVLMK